MKTTKQRDGEGPHCENTISAAAAEGKQVKTMLNATVKPEDRAFGRQLSTNNNEAAGATILLQIAPDSKPCTKVS